MLVWDFRVQIAISGSLRRLLRSREMNALVSEEAVPDSDRTPNTAVDGVWRDWIAEQCRSLLSCSASVRALVLHTTIADPSDRHAETFLPCLYICADIQRRKSTPMWNGWRIHEGELFLLDSGKGW
ncbi:hypothetical protein BDV11DRAFT_180446 [Aspergillus similis]